MASAYSTFLSPKENVLVMRKLAEPEQNYTPKSQLNGFQSPKTLSLAQKIRSERVSLARMAENTHRKSSNNLKMLTEGSESTAKAKTHNFIIKTKSRTNEGLMGSSIIDKIASPIPQNILGNSPAQTTGLKSLNSGSESTIVKPCWDANFGEDPEITTYREDQLMKVLNSDSLREKKMSLEELLEENPDYFGHLFAMCACYRCSCGRCKCKYALENNLSCKFNIKGKSTTYGKDFCPKSPDGFVPKTDKIHNFEGFFGNKPPMESVTISQTDYRPFSQNLNIRQRPPDFVPKDTPFYGITNYKSEFADWRSYDRLFLKRPVHSTVLHQLPFMGNTTYKDSFGGRKGSKTQIISPNNKAPFLKLYPFPSESTSRSAYQNPTNPTTKCINTMSNFKSVYSVGSPEGLEKNNCPASPLHFQSTMTQDFQVSEGKPCPVQQGNVREDFRQRLTEKIRDLNQKYERLKEERVTNK